MSKDFAPFVVMNRLFHTWMRDEESLSVKAVIWLLGAVSIGAVKRA